MKNTKNKRAIITILIVSVMMISATFIGSTKTVFAGSISFTQDTYTFVAGDYDPIVSVNADNGVDIWSSSNEAVAKIEYGGYDTANLDIKGIGKTTITATDRDGDSATCEVTVTEDDWYLEKTKAEVLVSEEETYIDIESANYYNSFKATSSKPSVVGVNAYNNYIEIYVRGVGTSTITVTDKFGKSETCTFTVKPTPFILNLTSYKFNNYETYEDNSLYINSDNDYNDVKSATSSNQNVAKVKIIIDDGYHLVQVDPVGVGTATITIKDQYGQTATASVSVTQKYIDESKYLEDLEYSEIYDPDYGDPYISVTCYITPNVYAIINGKKYTGSVYDKTNYIIKIPKLPAETKITVYLEKGLAVYRNNIKIDRKPGADLSAKIGTQTYTGKALKPAVTIKHGKYILKKGTDYTVKYSKNKKIGKAKATITFKGNYKGTKTVYFDIGPKGTSLTKLIPIKNGAKIRWKKRTKNVDGYQIQYSPDKDEMSYGNKKNIKGNKTTSTKVTDMWNGDKYYVRIRTYKKVGSQKIYSKWSKIKAVKPKW